MDNALKVKAAGALGMAVADFDKLPEAVKENAAKMISENESLSQIVGGTGKFSFGLGDKGTVVVKGFGAYPHTFYFDQSDAFFAWIEKAETKQAYETFKKVNAAKLITKAAAVTRNSATAKA